MDFLPPDPECPPGGGSTRGEDERCPYRNGFRYGYEPAAANPPSEEAAGPGRQPAGDGGWPGDGEVLESGPERPPAEGGLDRLAKDARRRWRGAGASAPWRRRAAAVAAALAATAALVALRAGAPTVPLEQEQAAAADITSAPVIVYARPGLQPPPFDRLPGRTPIPQPSPIGRPAEAVRGALPATGPAPAEQAARDAARLVLGRYCRYPQAYLVVLESSRGWREVTAMALLHTYLEERRLATLQLRWTGQAYSWQGWPRELARCA